MSILVERSSGLGRRPSGSALWRSAVYSVPAGSFIWPALLGFGPLRRLVRAAFVFGRGGHDLADDADCYVRQPACGALNRVLGGVGAAVRSGFNRFARIGGGLVVLQRRSRRDQGFRQHGAADRAVEDSLDRSRLTKELRNLDSADLLRQLERLAFAHEEAPRLRWKPLWTRAGSG